MRTFLLIALLAFFFAVTGADLIARISIGQLSLSGAVHEHLKWAIASPVGIVLLLAPFPVVALICAIAHKRARPGSAVSIFAAALLILLYFYFDAFQAAERALLNGFWTAAALSIGLLPIAIGIPTVMLTAAAAALVAGVNRRPSA